MGNNEGLLEAMSNLGRNKVVNIANSDWYFSFACGDEIAFTDGKKFYVLNCDSKLWSKVKEFVKESTTEEQAKQFWYEIYKSNDYEVSIGGAKNWEVLK